MERQALASKFWPVWREEVDEKSDHSLTILFCKSRRIASFMVPMNSYAATSTGWKSNRGEITGQDRALYSLCRRNGSSNSHAIQFCSTQGEEGCPVSAVFSPSRMR